jgi:hypothetical protein
MFFTNYPRRFLALQMSQDVLEAVGLNQVIVLPNYDTRDDVLVDISRHLIGTEPS